MTTARSVAPVTATVIAAMLVGMAAIASATGLGGIEAASLWSWSDRVTVDVPDPEEPPGPVVLRCDTFDGPDGALDGRVPSCGGSAWSTVGRPWTVAGGRVEVNGGSGSRATLSAGARDVTVEVTVHGVDQPNRAGGVLVASSGGTEHLAVVVRGRTTIELRRGDGTLLATAQQERSATTHLRVTLNGNRVDVVVDGTVTISGTFPLAALTGSGVGLVHDGGPPVGFSQFTVTSPA